VSRPRIVIDTNVIVSAALKPGRLEEAVVFLIADRRCELMVSPAVYAEYYDVLRRPRLQLRPERVDYFLQLLSAEGSLVKMTSRLSVSPHESDNRFLECAEAARADFLTGNQRHFPNVWKSTRVVSARELLESLQTL
jgi:putative PIN family toxin of toxin-antitoxin system